MHPKICGNWVLLIYLKIPTALLEDYSLDIHNEINWDDTLPFNIFLNTRPLRWRITSGVNACCYRHVPYEVINKRYSTAKRRKMPNVLPSPWTILFSSISLLSLHILRSGFFVYCFLLSEWPYRSKTVFILIAVARGFGPFRIWPPDVSALFHFGPGGFGPSIWKCRIFANLLDFLLFVLALFPNNLWSKSRTTAIKQGRQLLHEPSLTFYFLFLLHSIFQFDLSQLFV